jgi:hypothetical protein
VIVAVVAVGMVQVAVNQVIDVVAVGDRFMTAAGPVLVVLGMVAAIMGGRASGGIGAADGDSMFLDLIAGGMVQMAVVEIIDVAVMFQGLVAAAGTMLVRVVGVSVCHGSVPFSG